MAYGQLIFYRIRLLKHLRFSHFQNIGKTSSLRLY